MSIFPTHDISLNRYYYSFYSYNPSEDANVIKSFTYDNTQTLVETKDISFNTKSPTEMITFLENSGTNPYAVGKSGAADFRSMDLAFGGVYKKGFKETQRQALMTYLNTTYKNIHAGAVQEYAVTVSNPGSGNKYYLDGNGPAYTVYATSSGIYVFDQSDSTNVTHPLVIGETDGAGTYYSSMITEGTIGSLNGYTIVDISAGTPDLYYYCSAHSGMGGQIWNFISATTITVTAANYNGSNVYYLNGTRQPELSIAPFSVSAGNRYYFDLSSSTLSGTDFMLGTTNDVSGSELSSSMISYSSASIGTSGSYLALDVPSGYGNTIFYFDRYVLNMGWIPPDWVEKASVVVGSSMNYLNVTVGSSRIYTNTAFYDKNLGLIKNSLNYGKRMSKNGEYVLDTESNTNAIYRRKYNTNGEIISTNTLVYTGGTHAPWGDGVISDDGSVIISPRGGGFSISFNGSSWGSSDYFYTSTSTNYKRTKGLSGSGNCFIAAQSTTLLFYSISGTTITSRGSTTIENITDLNAYPIPISYNGLIYALSHYVSGVASWKVYKRTSVTTNNHTIIGEFSGIGYLSLSSDGTHIAVAEPTEITGKQVISGYKYDGSGSSWTKIGSSINTNPASSSSPTTLAMGYIDDSLTTLYIADHYPTTSKTLKKYDFE